MHVLVSAYACAPTGVSEAGNGWGWATHLAARGLRVHVLTVETKQAEIEEHLTSTNSALTFSFIEPSQRDLLETSGRHYLMWQFAALKVARTLHASDPFDVIHHVTYGSIHVPTQLWRLGVPIIFGPVGGGQVAPYRLLPYLKSRIAGELARTIFTKLLPYSMFHRWSYRHIDHVLTTNYETMNLAMQMGARRVTLGLDTGLPEAYFAAAPRRFEGGCTLRLLWVGRMFPRKGLILALDALAEVKVPVQLTILGGGMEPEAVHRMISERHLQECVFWSGGQVSRAEVQTGYANHDALLFTSLRESFGSQQLEAMASALPLITLNMNGARAFIPDAAAIKVNVTNKQGTIANVATAIEQFAALLAEERNVMSSAALAFARQYTWPETIDRAIALYGKVVGPQ